MERLPQEILAEIARHLPRRKPGDQQGEPALAPLAALSSSWQYAIEPLTFRSLRITSDELDELCSAFAADTRRRRFLRQLHVDLILPRYTPKDYTQYETAADRAANNKAFGHHLSTLLRELSRWPAGGKLELDIDMFSPTDKRPYSRTPPYYDGTPGGKQDLHTTRFRWSYIRFVHNPLVVVPCVASFRLSPEPRHMESGDQFALMAAFPNLEVIDLTPSYSHCFLPLRRQQIQNLCDAVTGFQPQPACKTLHVHFNPPYYPHKIRLPNRTISFCGALGDMLGRSSIQNLTYSGPIDPTLFWPGQTPETESPSCWNSLRQISIHFSLVSSTGQWFFKGCPGNHLHRHESTPEQGSVVPFYADMDILPPGYYELDEENERALAQVWAADADYPFAFQAYSGCDFRCIPRDEAILPLLAAIARRLVHAPSLRRVYLQSQHFSLDKLWFFLYRAPGESSRYDHLVDREGSGCDNPLSRTRIFVYYPNWKPDDKTLALLRGVGKICHGQDAIVTCITRELRTPYRGNVTVSLLEP